MIIRPQSNSLSKYHHNKTLTGNTCKLYWHSQLFTHRPQIRHLAPQVHTATMPSVTKVVTTLVFLASAAIALPVHVARQQTSECATGTWYYSCNTNVGCFDHDPCAKPTAVSGGTPEKAKDKPTATTTSSSVKTIVPATLYDIYPENPDESSGPVNGVHLETWKDKSQVEQVIFFKNIPADAKNCNLSWRQGPRYSRRFFVKNSDAQADARPLSGFPRTM